MKDIERRILLGRVVGAFGVRGEIKLESWTEPRSAIFRYQPWIVRSPSGVETTIEGVRGRDSGKHLVARFPGVEDRDTVEAMHGTEIYVARLQDGALNDAESAAQDSFEGDLGLLDCPHYSQPAQHPLGDVPDVLRSGNHAAIAAWRRQQSLLRTAERRPDLLDEQALGKADRKLLEQGRQARNQKASP